MDWHRPFLCHIFYAYIEQFQEAIFIWERALCFGQFSELAVHSLDGICRVDDFADWCGVFEIDREILPFFTP